MTAYLTRLVYQFDRARGRRQKYSYRGKGGKQGKRERPQPAFRAIQLALEAFGKDFATMNPIDSLWPSSAGSGQGITSGTFYGNLRRYFKAAGSPSSRHPHCLEKKAKLTPNVGQR